jgi:hypothetical protein
MILSASRSEVTPVRPLAITLILALGASAVGCGEKTTGGASPSEATGASVTRFRIGRAVASDGTVTVETDSFGQGDPIYISFGVKNVPPKSQVKVVWSDSSKRKISEEQKQLAPATGLVSFEMKGAAGLAIGDYAVEFYYGDPGVAPEKWLSLGGHPIRVGWKRPS